MRVKNNKIKKIETFIDDIRKKDKYANPEFNKIPKYYINLDRSEDRNKHMEKQIVDYEVENIERFNAIDGNPITNINKGEINGIKWISEYFNCTRYQLAITLSHLECIRKAGEKGIFPFMIMEDDVDFLLINKWKPNIDQVIEKMPEDCEMLSLFHYNPLNYHLQYKKIFKGAVCYIVTKNFYDKMINLLYKDDTWNLSKNLPINNIIFDLGIKDLFNFYSYGVPMILQNIKNLYSCHDGRFNGDHRYMNIYNKSVKCYI